MASSYLYVCVCVYVCFSSIISRDAVGIKQLLTFCAWAKSVQIWRLRSRHYNSSSQFLVYLPCIAGHWSASTFICSVESMSFRRVNQNCCFRRGCYAIWSEAFKTRNTKEKRVLEFVIDLDKIINKRNGVSSA